MSRASNILSKVNESEDPFSKIKSGGRAIFTQYIEKIFDAIIKEYNDDNLFKVVAYWMLRYKYLLIYNPSGKSTKKKRIAGHIAQVDKAWSRALADKMSPENWQWFFPTYLNIPWRTYEKVVKFVTSLVEEWKSKGIEFDKE